jgi:ribonuclease Z
MTTMNLEGRKKPLEIYAPEAEKFVYSLLSIGYWNRSFDVIPKNVEFEGNQMELLVDDEEFQVTSIPVKHSIPAVGFCLQEKDRIKIDKEKTKKLGLPAKGPLYKKLKEKGFVEYKEKTIKVEDVSFIEKGKKVAYSGDTLPCKNMAKLAKDADLLIHDSTYFNDDTRTSRHANVDQVISLAKEANAKRTILTHISRRYTDMQELTDKIKKEDNVSIAKDLMSVVV